MSGQHALPGTRRIRPGRMLLTAGAVLGTLCLVVALAGLLFDVKPLVFRSGSMSPEIPAGSLGFARTVDATDLHVGDVVSVHAADGTRITHRITAIDDASRDAVALTLRGDANRSDDAETYQVAAADRLFASMPYVGHAVAFLGGRLGMFLLGAVTLGLLAYAFRPTRGDRTLIAAVAAPTIALLFVNATASGTSAAFTDTATTTSGSLQAHTVVSQAQPACQNVDGVLILGNIARVTWAHVDARYEYAWELRTTAGAVATSGVIGGGQAAGSTVTLDLGTGLIGLNANYNLVVRARLRSPTTWVAGATTSTPVRRASILIIGAAMRCGHA